MQVHLRPSATRQQLRNAALCRSRLRRLAFHGPFRLHVAIGLQLFWLTHGIKSQLQFVRR
jgi:hypothetical protein